MIENAKYIVSCDLLNCFHSFISIIGSVKIGFFEVP